MIQFLTTLALALSLSHGTPTISFQKDFAVAQAEAQRQKRPIFVHFTAPWCEPCHEMMKNVYPTPEIKARLARFVTVEIDVESEQGARLWSTYHLDTLPTLAFLNPLGVELKSHRVVEMQEAAPLAKALDRAYDALTQSEPPKEGPESTNVEGLPWFALATVTLLMLVVWVLARRRTSSDA